MGKKAENEKKGFSIFQNLFSKPFSKLNPNFIKLQQLHNPLSSFGHKNSIGDLQIFRHPLAIASSHPAVTLRQSLIASASSWSITVRQPFLTVSRRSPLLRQDVTDAAMRACRDAISSNSIPAFRSGSC